MVMTDRLRKEKEGMTDRFQMVMTDRLRKEKEGITDGYD